MECGQGWSFLAGVLAGAVCLFVILLLAPAPPDDGA